MFNNRPNNSNILQTNKDRFIFTDRQCNRILTNESYLTVDSNHILGPFSSAVLSCPNCTFKTNAMIKIPIKADDFVIILKSNHNCENKAASKSQARIKNDERKEMFELVYKATDLSSRNAPPQQKHRSLVTLNFGILL